MALFLMAVLLAKAPKKPQFYTLYGVNLSSEIELPLVPKTTIPKKIDIYISFSNSIGNKSFMFKDRKDNSMSLKHALIFSRKNKLAFEITNGKEIIIHQLCKDLNFDEIAIILLNSPLGYCLYQQKKLVLHSCGISNHHGAYLFIGESGTGKSSLAASLLDDFDFITEDVAALEFNDKSVNIFQGPPYVKLDKPAAKGSKLSESESIEISFDRLKRSAFKTKNNSRNIHPIKKIYILEWGEDFLISKIKDNKLLATYLLNTFTAYPFESCRESSKISLTYFSKLIKEIDFFLLTRDKKRGYKDNNSIIEHILKDL